jgi:predicted transcriptional regulator
MFNSPKIVTTTQLKSDLHQLIDKSRDSKLLSIIYQLLTSTKSKSVDWWDTLTEEQKADLQGAIDEIDKGKGVPHKEVMAKYKGKY